MIVRPLWTLDRAREWKTTIPTVFDTPLLEWLNGNQVFPAYWDGDVYGEIACCRVLLGPNSSYPLGQARRKHFEQLAASRNATSANRDGCRTIGPIDILATVDS